jgi:hypothetical protein
MCCGLTINSSAIGQKEATALTGKDLAALLQRVHVNRVANGEIARQYASDDRTHTVAINKSGKTIQDKTEKVEVVIVGGLPYRHIVEENGKPLSTQKLISAQKHQDALSVLGQGFDFTFDLRDGNPRDSVYSALPICCLAALFENRLLRHEQINGRDNLVVESVPKANPAAVTPVERTALDWKETTWIDVEDLMPARYEIELLNDKSFLLKGSKEQREFFKLEKYVDTKGVSTEKVWLLRSKEGHYNLKFLWQRQFLTFEDTSYNYKKFKVDTRIDSDSMREITNQKVSQKP